VIGLCSHDKARTDKVGMSISKKPKKHENILCPQCKGTNAETLKQQTPIGEGDQELEKRSVREESTQNVTHLYMKAMLGISLYSYPYLN
jgi:hypothetical protein